MSAMWTDIFFACPARKVLTARQKHEAPTYTYLFDITPSCPPDEVRLGASHTAELFFVFGITENLPPPIGRCDFTPVGSEKLLETIASMTRRHLAPIAALKSDPESDILTTDAMWEESNEVR